MSVSLVMHVYMLIMIEMDKFQTYDDDSVFSLIMMVTKIGTDENTRFPKKDNNQYKIMT